MATRLSSSDLAISSLLCFTVSKRSKLTEKSLKSIISDFDSIDDIISAKKRLLSDIETFSSTDSGSFPRFPDRAGDKRLEREVGDLFNILNIIDERKIGIKLPTYVTDNCDKIPSVKLDDGDLRFLLGKMDKMATTIKELQVNVNSIHAMLTVLNKPSGPRSGPATMQSVNNSHTHTSAQPAVSTRCSGSKGSLEEWPCLPLQPPLQSFVDQHQGRPIGLPSSVASQSADLRSSWADDPGTSTSISTGDSCNDMDGFQRQESRKKRLRLRTRSQVHGGSVSAPTFSAIFAGSTAGQVPAQSSSHHGGLGAKSKTVADAPGPATKTEKSLNSRKPLVVGKSTVLGSNMNMINNNGQNSLVSAAKPFKSIYCVDNVSPSCDVSSMVEFVSDLGVRVLSCFEVIPRHRRFNRAQAQTQGDQSGGGQCLTPTSKAFRLCINRADNSLLLRDDVWPSDITISKWYFVKDSTSVDVESKLVVHATSDQLSNLKSVVDMETGLNADILALDTSNRFDALQSSDIEIDNDATIIDVGNMPIAVTNTGVVEQLFVTCSPIQTV